MSGLPEYSRQLSCELAGSAERDLQVICFAEKIIRGDDLATVLEIAAGLVCTGILARAPATWLVTFHSAFSGEWEAAQADAENQLTRVVTDVMAGNVSRPQLPAEPAWDDGTAKAVELLRAVGYEFEAPAGPAGMEIDDERGGRAADDGECQAHQGGSAQDERDAGPVHGDTRPAPGEAQGTGPVAPASPGADGPDPELSSAPAAGPPGRAPAAEGNRPEGHVAAESPDAAPQPMVQLGAMELTAAEEKWRCRLLDAAVGYAQRGWRVIPVWWVDEDGNCQCRRGKECASPGKHPIVADWPEIATNDPVAVARWWTPPDQWSPQGGLFDPWYPLANVGIVTGRGSGILVIDVDPRNGGDESLGNLIDQHEDLPLTRIHKDL